jgi:hypothetical protein
MTGRGSPPSLSRAPRSVPWPVRTGQRTSGSQPASGHQPGPCGLRPDHGFGQCDRGLAGTTVGWVLRLLARVLAALLIAGFTNLAPHAGRDPCTVAILPPRVRVLAADSISTISVVARSFENLWLWLAGTFVALCAVSIPAAVTLDTTSKVPYSLWTSAPMIVAYIMAGLAPTARGSHQASAPAATLT